MSIKDLFHSKKYISVTGLIIHTVSKPLRRFDEVHTFKIGVGFATKNVLDVFSID